MIPLSDHPLPDFDAKKYLLLDEGLKRAVELAIRLHQPLLLTGEPGTGKTRLAYKLAHDFSQQYPDFLPEPLVFNTKTSSEARDLFYTYDALAHFQHANIKRDTNEMAKNASAFIELQALGKAIAYTCPESIAGQPFAGDIGDQAYSSVVLIDEIDKAPRDFPNDILNEIEQLSFEIKELDKLKLAHKREQRILVIMTSNSEKNLPDAFLRRCVFYDIPFPDKRALTEIAKAQLGLKPSQAGEKLLDDLLDLFRLIRSKSPRKPAATAELIAWLRVLEMEEIFNAKVPTKDAKTCLAQNLSLLVKTREDRDALRSLMQPKP